MTEPIPVALGTPIEVGGVVYVVLSISCLLDGEGRSVNLHAKDPLLAAAHRQQAEQRREALEKMLKVADQALEDGQ